jgi:hypothetical protein
MKTKLYSRIQILSLLTLPLILTASAFAQNAPKQEIKDIQPSSITSLTLSEVIIGCGNECAGIKAVWGVKSAGPKPVEFVVQVQEQAPCIRIGGQQQCRSETFKVGGLARSAVTGNLSPVLTGSVVGTFKVTVTGKFNTGKSSSASKIQSFNLP